jgi:hypothetical protein
VHPTDRPIFGEPACSGTADLRLPLAALCTGNMLKDLASQPRPELRAPRLSASNRHVLILRHTAMSEERCPWTTVERAAMLGEPWHPCRFSASPAMEEAWDVTFESRSPS